MALWLLWYWTAKEKCTWGLLIYWRPMHLIVWRSCLQFTEVTQWRGKHLEKKESSRNFHEVATALNKKGNWCLNCSGLELFARRTISYDSMSQIISPLLLVLVIIEPQQTTNLSTFSVNGALKLSKLSIQIS